MERVSFRLPWTQLQGVSFPLILAPMAGLSHGAFRRLIEEVEPFDLYFSEMISAGALASRGRFESYYLDDFPGNQRIVFQLVSPRGDLLVRAAERLAPLVPAGIDINLGCSAPEIVRNGGGIAWLQRPDDVLTALHTVADAIAPLPLSVKLRLPTGYREEAMVSFIRQLPEAGVSAVTIHPRYQRQSYSRPAHHQILARLAEASPLPVIASGDIRDQGSLSACRHLSGVAGAMIGREAVARPWIVRELRRPGGSASRHHVDQPERAAVAERFFALLEAHQPPEFWLSRARRFVSFYLGQLPFGRRVAAQLQDEGDYQAVRHETCSFLAHCGQIREVASC